jgi:hypothetical protein
VTPGICLFKVVVKTKNKKYLHDLGNCHVYEVDKKGSKVTGLIAARATTDCVLHNSQA